MSESSMIPLKMTRTFASQPEKVYEAWLAPDIFSKWLFTAENTNQVAENQPEVGGSWEIIDRREGKDYRAIGTYMELDRPNRIVMTFEMPQFSDTTDELIISLKAVPAGTEMTFMQNITVPHEEGWGESEIGKALQEYHDSSEYGWNLMFQGLKALLETGENPYKG
ncbi:ATPase [Bhargavaea cecembensis]|uniref:ATPase n=1 Tax=Bhargavaea cecembensis TaxID=394098 RepID=A0A161RDU3_9BACL|nr:SRPBCC domain-containing protein [Bhargavaea cecembensis]KZE37832.1 ATPase [Bhargavaea cecembensis]